ncbi:hypothetical protein [Occallatibacter savannae]|uniref:hypothetical protein n=1 Tax=Occallatibacter savannae TaxID=1002691 RepID=UPI000D68C0E4|nr:hypothetical protein [Occallatibacter savannae]
MPLFLRREAHGQFTAIVFGHRLVDVFHVLAEGSAQGRLHVERKWMIAGRTALNHALSDKVRWQAKPGHGVSKK